MDKITEFKAGISLVCTAVAALLGWRGVLIVIWLIAMLLDYISGTCAAMKCAEWSSKVAREGLWHKGGMLVVVLVAAMVDMGISVAADNLSLGISWTGWFLPLVCAFYVITELGSVLENAIKMGAAVPTWMTKALKISQDAVEAAAAAKVGGEDDGTSGD